MQCRVRLCAVAAVMMICASYCLPLGDGEANLKSALEEQSPAEEIQDEVHWQVVRLEQLRHFDSDQLAPLTDLDSEAEYLASNNDVEGVKRINEIVISQVADLYEEIREEAMEFINEACWQVVSGCEDGATKYFERSPGDLYEPYWKLPRPIQLTQARGIVDYIRVSTSEPFVYYEPDADGGKISVDILVKLASDSNWHFCRFDTRFYDSYWIDEARLSSKAVDPSWIIEPPYSIPDKWDKETKYIPLDVNGDVASLEGSIPDVLEVYSISPKEPLKEHDVIRMAAELGHRSRPRKDKDGKYVITNKGYPVFEYDPATGGIHSHNRSVEEQLYDEDNLKEKMAFYNKNPEHWNHKCKEAAEVFAKRYGIAPDNQITEIEQGSGMVGNKDDGGYWQEQEIERKALVVLNVNTCYPLRDSDSFACLSNSMPAALFSMLPDGTIYRVDAYRTELSYMNAKTISIANAFSDIRNGGGYVECGPGIDTTVLRVEIEGYELQQGGRITALPVLKMTGDRNQGYTVLVPALEAGPKTDLNALVTD